MASVGGAVTQAIGRTEFEDLVTHSFNGIRYSCYSGARFDLAKVPCPRHYRLQTLFEKCFGPSDCRIKIAKKVIFSLKS